MKFSIAALASFCVLAVALAVQPAVAGAIKVTPVPQNKNNNDNGKNNHCDDVKDCKDKAPLSQSKPVDEDHGACNNNDNKGSSNNTGNGKGNDKDSKDNGHDNNHDNNSKSGGKGR
jgi:hypothetical protein